MRTTARRVISSLFALMLLSTAGLSQVMSPPRVARSVASAPIEVAQPRWPIELSVSEDVRERCRKFELPPEPYVIEPGPGSESEQQALAGLGACLSGGPLGAEELDLLGPSELPSRIEHAAETGAAADVVRVLLNRLGVPFERMVTHDVPLDPLSSSHAAPRVVLAVGQSARSAAAANTTVGETD